MCAVGLNKALVGEPNIEPRAGHPKFYQLTAEEARIHEAKSRDYAYGGDPLGNFKRVSTILAQYSGLKLSDPEVIALVYMLKQLDAALWMLANRYEGKIETINTRLQDVGVYSKLAQILHTESLTAHGEPGVE